MLPPPPPPKGVHAPGGVQIYGRRQHEEEMAARREAEAAALEEQQRAAAGAADDGEDDPERQAFEAMLEQLAAEMQKVRGLAWGAAGVGERRAAVMRAVGRRLLGLAGPRQAPLLAWQDEAAPPPPSSPC
jgi:hypothetical protein